MWLENLLHIHRSTVNVPLTTALQREALNSKSSGFSVGDCSGVTFHNSLPISGKFQCDKSDLMRRPRFLESTRGRRTSAPKSIGSNSLYQVTELTQCAVVQTNMMCYSM